MSEISFKGKIIKFQYKTITRSKICKSCGKKNLDAYRKIVSGDIHIPMCGKCRHEFMELYI